MAWERIDVSGSGVFQWSDVAVADACFHELVSRTSDAAMASVDGMSFADQAAHVLATWQALSGAFKAMNVPPIACPYYAKAWLDSVNLHRSRARGCVASWNMNAIPQLRVTVDSGHLLCNVIDRITLDLITGDVQQNDYDKTASQSGAMYGCSFWKNGKCDAPWDCSQVYTWNTAAFAGGETVFGIPAGPVCGVTKFVSPLRWFMDVPRAIADAWQQTGTVDLVKQSVLFAILADIDQANKAGITTQAVQETTTQLPVIIARVQAANVAEAQRNLALMSSAVTGAATALAAAGAAAGEAGPFGVVVGAMFAFIAILVQVVGIAVGQAVDVYGQPILDPTRMTRGWVPWTIYDGAPPSATVGCGASADLNSILMGALARTRSSTNIGRPVTATASSGGGGGLVKAAAIGALALVALKLLSSKRK